MKIKSFYFFLFLIFLNNCNLFAKEYFVRWVSDGDTIILENDKRIRYIGINTPEVAHKDKNAEAFGNEASAYNKMLVLNKKVRLEFDKEKYDQYGRQLAYVFLEDGTFVNLKLVEEGYAHVLPKVLTAKYSDLFLKAQRKAMSDKKGLWRNFIGERNGYYIANKLSKRFHNASCRYEKKMSEKNKIFFTKKWDAFWEGYAPCKECQK